MASITVIPLPARVLGFAGAIPFVAAAVCVWMLEQPWNWGALDVQIYYGCAILSFLGAVHWGRALAEPSGTQVSWRPYLWGVTPSLIAWVAALTKPDLALVILMAGVIAAYAVDRAAVALRWFPEWYGELRKYLTAIVIASLGASLLKAMA